MRNARLRMLFGMLVLSGVMIIQPLVPSTAQADPWVGKLEQVAACEALPDPEGQMDLLWSYSTGGWLSWFGLEERVAFTCGHDGTLGGDPLWAQHGYRHIATRHQTDWENAASAIRQAVPGMPLLREHWLDLADFVIGGAIIQAAVEVPRGKKSCYGGFGTWMDSEGHSYEHAYAVVVLDQSDLFADRTVQTAHPSRKPCDVDVPVNDRSTAADRGFVASCTETGCTSDLGDNGTLTFAPGAGTAITGGPLQDAWEARGGPTELGYPTTDPHCERSGEHVNCEQRFQHGAIYTRNEATYTSSGKVGQKYLADGAHESSLGYPISSSACGLVNDGCRQHYASNSSIYYTAATGAHDVRGEIRKRWQATKWQDGPLGYPTRNHKCGFKENGCNTHFQGGSIYHTPATGAHDVRGDIKKRWQATGWQDGPLGYPTSNHKCGFKENGCNTHFQGGSIYHTPATGAHVVSGPIRSYWSSLGWQDSELGYPIAAEEPGNNNGRLQRFQHAAIYWSEGTGAMIVYDFKRR